jgi:rhamnose utilization protein RhaD (predicted bifunctional aldolase and dehydrogenase)/NAD(P)-dependent dehydrogenase (short-subunit alcohol dehydrogenase family)
MENRWSDVKAAEFIAKYGAPWGEDLAICTYNASLIGAESGLVLHGGGNSSVKTERLDLFGEKLRVLFIKASGYNMASIEPRGFSGLDLDYLRKLRSLPELSDQEMVNQFRTHLLDASSANPSIETLVHAFIPKKFVDHTHPDAILALTNQGEGKRLIREALGENVEVLEYFPPGFELAKEVADRFEKTPAAEAIILIRHGLVTWGETARESYEKTVELVRKAEKYLSQSVRKPLAKAVPTPLESAERRLAQVAPIVRGLLAQPSGDPDHPWAKSILSPLINRAVLDFLDSDGSREIALTPPLTSDHLIRTKPFYLWVDTPEFENTEAIRSQFSKAIQNYASAYDSYVSSHSALMPEGVERMDSLPRVILVPGLGVICAGANSAAAEIARDIAEHTLSVKAQIATMGTYSGLTERDLFHMEYRSLQHRKLQNNGNSLPLAGQIALVTGAAGAIGSGIVQELLEQGCNVAATDLEGDPLHKLVQELKQRFGSRVIGVPLDITDPQSAADGFGSVLKTWGGVDLVVLNAGVAHVSSLPEINLQTFQKLEKINVEGVLIMLSECARLFKLQGTGGDIVMISTKNVFAPGAKFGGYSATKAAGHQLARIASQEFAEMDVRVNMVAPDAVFSHGSRKSGLWTQIGPDRMNARGLSPEGLEEYYRNRNLLKARITARHVAKAVLFFATRQTPTTGATIPVDGGLPDATPR